MIILISSDGAHKCDEKCYNAKSMRCTCICGGVNHGVGLRQAIENLEARQYDLLFENKEEKMIFSNINEILKVDVAQCAPSTIDSKLLMIDIAVVQIDAKKQNSAFNEMRPDEYLHLEGGEYNISRIYRLQSADNAAIHYRSLGGIYAFDIIIS